ncbi:MAG: hypothetical protein ISEC1_P0432 [Thiomicrorhabdus sp.]|nr:MAG: hypothetical protein ISEC1_P0432 [Thiomicrorhabdus sp.]
MKTTKIIILGLGRLGQRFYTNMIDEKQEACKIIAVYDQNIENPYIDDMVEHGIQFFPKLEDAMRQLGSQADIIMDTTYCQNLTSAIQNLLIETQNDHTVLVSMVDYLKQKNDYA